MAVRGKSAAGAFQMMLLTLKTLHRFYIEKITYLKENTTVELFFLNAKSLVFNVSMHIFHFFPFNYPFGFSDFNERYTFRVPINALNWYLGFNIKLEAGQYKVKIYDSRLLFQKRCDWFEFECAPVILCGYRTPSTHHLFLFNYCKSGVQSTALLNSTGRTWTQRSIIRCSALSVFFAGESRTVAMGNGDCWTCFSGRTIFIRQGGLLLAKSSVCQSFHGAFECLLLTLLDAATLSFRKRKRSRAPRGQSATPRLVLNRLP